MDYAFLWYLICDIYNELKVCDDNYLANGGDPVVGQFKGA